MADDAEQAERQRHSELLHGRFLQIVCYPNYTGP